MSSYNIAFVRLRCIRCQQHNDFEVHLTFGNTGLMQTLSIGEKYPFVHGKAPQNGGAFDTNPAWGEGYTDCSICGKDFYCRAMIDEGILADIQPNLNRTPLDFDHQEENSLPCPSCKRTNGRVQIFTGYRIAKYVCDHPECGVIIDIDY